LQVHTAGATPVQVPLTDYTYDLDAMLAAITDRTRLIFVCNPNNPTSTVVDPEAPARFVEAVPSDILIALDEAYVEYIRDGLLPDSFGLVRKHSNVVVLRTFSKAYGLPGRAQEFANDSANSGVIVRPYGDDGVRVTVAAPHENDAFLDFAQRWTKERV
jgi:histidinol-phosphate/aromatic aminotransferase/cobyric acid decarboxylase-like protein